MNLQPLIDALASALSNPTVWHAAIFLGFLGIVLLRKSIGTLISKATYIHAGPVDVKASPQEQQEGIERAEVAEHEIESVKPPEKTTPDGTRVALPAPEPLVARRVSELEGWLIKAWPDAEDQRQVLVRLAAEHALNFHHLWSERFIFGSQIEAVIALNAGERSRDDLRAIFEKAKAIWLDAYKAEDAFDRWLGFMGHRQLIEPAGDLFRITQTGRAFLIFLVKNGLTTPKIL